MFTKRKSVFIFLFAVLLMVVLQIINNAAVKAQSNDLATPQLIDKAFAEGKITSDERLLYFAYAIYEPASLPTEYQSDVGWFATRQVAELKDAYFNNSNLIESNVMRELDRLLAGPAATTYCDTPDVANVDTSTSANFVINYGTIGGGLTVNDYLTSLDTTYNKLTGANPAGYGWAKPPVCDASTCESGSAPPAAWGGKFPVIVAPLGSSVFGYVTNGGASYVGFVGDNPNTAITETDASASCMVLNDDFSQFSGNTAQENLDGTTSHEFVHAIQNAWGDPGASMPIMWLESVAAYFEDEIFDAGNTQYLYLYPQFQNPLGNWPAGGAPGGVSEYSNFTFFRYIAEQNGGANSSTATAGHKVLKKFYENVALSLPAVDQELTAYKNALAFFGGDLATQFHQYAIASKFMKDCVSDASYGSTYCYEEGQEYRNLMGSTPLVHGTIATFPGGPYNGTIENNYAINWVQLPASPSANYGITVQNTGGSGQLRVSLVCDKGTVFSIHEMSTVLGSGQTDQFAHFSPTAPTTCNEVVLVITNEEQTIARASQQGVTVDASRAPDATTTYTVTLSAPTAVTLNQLESSVNSSNMALYLVAMLSVFTLFALLLLSRKRGSQQG